MFPKDMVHKQYKQKLLKWFEENARPLPWRQTSDPYKIWISEVMLQQTVSAAVIPYYEKFLTRFPTVASLANADLEDVLEMWAGLGYYSRARNLHAAAKKLVNGFPRSFQQLLEYPGFGPYTSRSVASIAFDEPVGVLDGNVIRFLCRFFGLKVEWWRPQIRDELQVVADRWVQGVRSSKMNQALMEIGATICTPQSPACLICPLQTDCVGFKNNSVNDLPLKKPRKTKEMWSWQAKVYFYRDQLALVKNDYAPFLKGENIFPGEVQKLSRIPKDFDYKHNITHREIYVKLQAKTFNSKAKIPKNKFEWIDIKDINKKAHFSLILKALRLSRSS